MMNGDLQARGRGSAVLKRVRNQLLAKRFVWIACIVLIVVVIIVIVIVINIVCILPSSFSLSPIGLKSY